ncbi:MAG: hypothetical protein RIM72_13960 [Alphaproteobacteria bacterium]
MKNLEFTKVIKTGPSNKPKQTKIHIPQLVGPLIDRLSITVPLPSKYHDDARKALSNLHLEANPKLSPKTAAKLAQDEGVTIGPKGTYKRGFKFRGKDQDGNLLDTAFLLQADPGTGTKNFYRFEWNPRLFGPGNLESTKVLLSSVIPDGWSRVVMHGRITRLDVAFDLTKVDVNDLVLRGVRPQKFGLYVGADGRIETIYVGNPKGSHICAYDRMKAIKGNGSKEPIPEIGPVTRIESRKVGAQIPVKNIKDQGNPFKKVKVYSCSQKDLTFGIRKHWPAFRDMCQVRGFHRAMKAISKHSRKSIKGSLDNLRPSWWDEELNWSKWEDEIVKQQLLDPLPTDPPLDFVD